jgi:hypothetical protein
MWRDQKGSGLGRGAVGVVWGETVGGVVLTPRPGLVIWTPGSEAHRPCQSLNPLAITPPLHPPAHLHVDKSPPNGPRPPPAAPPPLV